MYQIAIVPSHQCVIPRVEGHCLNVATLALGSVRTCVMQAPALKKFSSDWSVDMRLLYRAVLPNPVSRLFEHFCLPEFFIVPAFSLNIRSFGKQLTER